MNVEAVCAGVHRIQLDKPSVAPDAARRTNNVYLVEADAPGLINVGHPSQYQQLTDALREIGVAPSDIERVVYTSWHVDSLGGATNFPRADHFVFSPDMVRPRHFEEWVASHRAAVRGVADEVLERVDEDWSREDVEEFMAAYFPPMTNELDFVPVRSGHTVRLAELELEIVAAPGPNPGHALLLDTSRGFMFCGDIPMTGFPREIDDLKTYLDTLDRAQELAPKWVFPTYGRPSSRGKWEMQRVKGFAENFLSHAPGALVASPTVMEFVDGDLGRGEDLLDYVYRIRAMRPFLDGLVQGGLIAAEGDGLDRRYGVGLPDPRAELR